MKRLLQSILITLLIAVIGFTAVGCSLINKDNNGDNVNDGNVNENVNINLSGKDMAIAFNGKYIMDFLKITDNEFINLNLNSSIDPCVITSVVDDGFLYLVLPVRINA